MGVNATGLTAADIRSGALDDLLSDPDALLHAAPVLIGAPVEVQRAFKARAKAVLAEAAGIDISSLQTVDLGLETDDIEAIAAAAEAETQRLIGEGLNAVNGTELTVQDVIDGKLDATIGIDTAIVNASEEVYAAYEERINAKLAEEAGISLQEIEFVNQAVLDAGVSSAEEAGRVAAEAATRFQNSQGAVAMDEARQAADEAQNLAQIASELEKAAIAEGTEDAKAAAEEAAKAAEQASEAARVAGEAAMAATEGIVARTAQEAAWEAASQNAYEQAISAARAAGASAEEAAAQAAEAAASAGQAAFEAAALAAARPWAGAQVLPRAGAIPPGPSAGSWRPPTTSSHLLVHSELYTRDTSSDDAPRPARPSWRATCSRSLPPPHSSPTSARCSAALCSPSRSKRRRACCRRTCCSTTACSTVRLRTPQAARALLQFGAMRRNSDASLSPQAARCTTGSARRMA